MGRRAVAAVVEPLDRELADGLEQSIADRARNHVGLDKGMTNQLVEGTEWVAGTGRRIDDRSVDADTLDRPRAGAAAEHGQPAEQNGLFRAEELVAPGQRSTERPVPIRNVERPARQQRQPVVEPSRDLVDPEPAHARGGELDRQRQPVEPCADLGDRRRILGRHQEVRHDARDAIDEQPGCVGLERARLVEGRHRVQALTRQPKLGLAGGNDRQARGNGEEVRQQRRRLEHVLEVVDDEQALSRPEVIGEDGLGGLAADLSHPYRDGDRGRDAPRVGD